MTPSCVIFLEHHMSPDGEKMERYAVDYTFRIIVSVPSGARDASQTAIDLTRDEIFERLYGDVRDKVNEALDDLAEGCVEDVEIVLFEILALIEEKKKESWP